MMASFRACPKQFFHSYLLHLGAKATSPDLHAGGAIAAGLDAARKAFYIERLTHDQSLYRGVLAFTDFWGSYEPPEDSPKTYINMLDAFVKYFEEYPLATDIAQPALKEVHQPFEHTFALPIPEVLHPITNEPFLYCGRYDMVANIHGALWIVDEKTTKGSLGESWARGWDMRGQFLGYTWAGRAQGHPIQGALVRGIAIQKSQTYFRQVFLAYPEFLVDRWYLQLVRDLKRMSDCYINSQWDYNFGESCTQYYGCAFVPLCSAQVPEDWLTLFKHREWNPLDRDPTNTREHVERAEESYTVEELMNGLQ